ncbi:hypothetical protein BN6_47580 [Saccharothrix espanaensis DSM 44229]|uniref:Uncharacterized protein n=2 Tax=Saccharothrix espanaensis TaxID=103731 RepID=K0K658_SACES|nr:hypothetical protein BN6_47580 [Saccharothrix espanaensis DSM 44229]
MPVLARLADDDVAGARALAALAGNPRAVIHLDDVVRRDWWWCSAHREAREFPVPRRRLDDPALSPLALALASAHRDGRVRERAVAAIVARPLPDLVPFLVVRTADWVPEVRRRARAGLALVLDDEPGLLPSALGVGLRVEDWGRGSFVQRQLVAAAAATDLSPLLSSSDPQVRWFAFTQGRWRTDRLVDLALTGAHVRLRAGAAEAAAREAVWTNRVALLRRLSGSGHAEVRSQALAGLTRLGHDTEVAAFLEDRSSLVRALARASAARIGVDPLAHYRSVVSRGALDGLGEIGSEADAGYLVGLFGHPVPMVRARAVRALRLLRVEIDDDVVPLLRDPSPAVVREAARAVRRVPDGLVWELLADERPVVRRAGYLLAQRSCTADWLRAALTAAVDPDPKPARRAVADTVRFARHTRKWMLADELPREHLPELRRLLDRAVPALEADVVDRLRALLA